MPPPLLLALRFLLLRPLYIVWNIVYVSWAGYVPSQLFAYPSLLGFGGGTGGTALMLWERCTAVAKTGVLSTAFY